MSWNAFLPADTSLIRLSAGYIRNNESAVQTVVSTSSLTGGVPYIPTTAPVWFYLDAVPTGWTILAGTPTDSVIAVKGGSGNYNAAGGTVAGDWTGAPVGLNIDQLANHTHTYATPNKSIGASGLTLCAGVPFGATGTTGATGTGATHQHDWGTLRPKAALGIICTKNA